MDDVWSCWALVPTPAAIKAVNMMILAFMFFSLIFYLRMVTSPLSSTTLPVTSVYLTE